METKILIVDDDPDILNMLHHFLSRLDLIVESACHGQEALERLEKQHFDLVITDITMPHLDGIELTRHVRKNFPDTDVLVMTGYSEKYNATDVIRAGAIDFILKPISIVEFQAKIERILREKNALRTLQKKKQEAEQLRDQISDQNKFLDNVLNAITHPFYVIDPQNYQVLLLNKATQADSAVENQHCYSLIHNNDNPCQDSDHPCPITEILRTKKPVCVEHQHVNKQGNERTVEVHAYPAFNQNGEVEYIIEYCLDITERREAQKALKKSEAKYRELVEGVDELITQIDKEGHIVFINHMADTILGIPPEQCIGRSVIDFIHPDDRQETIQWFNESIGKQITSATYNNRRINQNNGTIHNLQWTCNFHYDSEGSLANLSAFATDISTLVKAKEEAEKTMGLQGQFLANMSHEIRTPLNVIIGMNQLILRTDLPADTRHYADIIYQNADLLLHTLNDILDYSKIEADQLVVHERPFTIHKLIEDESNTFNSECGEQKNTFTTRIGSDVPKFLLGDDFRIKQVLNNLINNANKFTQNGRIELSVTLQSSSDTKVVLLFKVQDNGIGISPNNQKNIFNRFQQADGSLSRKYGGVGLGLAICEKLISLLHGEIRLESEEGKGSTFLFSIPLARAEKKSIPAPSEIKRKSIHNHHLNILVVEDNAFNQDLLQTFLSQDKHTVHIAENGLEALTSLSQEDFDIILMDVQMPEVDGLEATRLIRLCESGDADGESNHVEILRLLQRRRQGQHIPIIGLTAHAFRRDKDNCINAGMDAYITKPFLPEELYGEIEKHFSPKNGENKPYPSGSTPPKQEQKEQPAVDPAHIRKFMLDKYKLPPENIDMLLKSMGNSLLSELDNAKEAIAKQDMETLSRSGHTIKGVLLNAGLDNWADMAFRIQKGNTRAGEDPFVYLEKLVTQLTEGLQPLIDEG